MANAYLTPWRRGSLAGGGLGGGSLFDLHRQMNRLFDDLFDHNGDGGLSARSGFRTPAMDLHQADDKLEITAELPGVREEDIDLTVEDGVLTGNCEDDNTSCNFASAAPEADPSCFELPAQVSSSGCGSSLACSTVQNGCDWVASCAGGEMLVGTATETGITFPGLSQGWLCSADLNPAGDALGGGCERENDDGSVSECRDLTDRQDARLVLTWPSTN